MSKRRQILWSCFLGIGILLASPSLSFSAPPQVNIGVVLHLSGDVVMQSNALREGIEIAAGEYNRSHPSDFQISLNVEDGKGTARGSNNAVHKLIHINNVSVAIVSDYLDALSSGMLLEQNKIPSVVLWDSSPEIENIGEYLFSIGPWTPSCGEEASRFAIDELHAKTAVVIKNNDPWSEKVSESFTETFQKRGGKILETFPLNPDETEFRNVLLRLKTLSPGVIYSPIDFNMIAFYSQLKQLRVNASVISTDVIADDQMQQAPQAFEGVYQTSLPSPKSETFEKLRALYQIKYGRPLTMGWFVAAGYDGMSVVIDAIRDSHVADSGAPIDAAAREKIKQSFYRIKNFPGATSVISFNDKGSSPQFEKTFKITGGKFVPTF